MQQCRHTDWGAQRASSSEEVASEDAIQPVTWQGTAQSWYGR